MTVLHETITTAYLQGDELVLEEFREKDPDVVSFVKAAEDTESAVHHCLAMGARALTLAGATLDTQLVEHRFGEMTGELDRSIDAFAKRVDESAGKLLDEETGGLAKALKSWLDDVTSTLDETFDENSRKSAIAKLEAVLVAARKEQVGAMRALLDPENAESPLAGWRSEIVKTVERQGKALAEGIDKLREQLAIQEAVGVEHELGTQKGRDFEHVVLDEATEIARYCEDTVEHTGDLSGSTGGKVGDLVVSIDPGATPGRTCRYVIEVKDKQMTQKAALAELDGAIANRDAEVGLLVFARQSQCPVRSPFQWFDHKAFVVLDKDKLDAHALRLGCLWARWMCLRDEKVNADTIDTARVEALLESARSALSTASTIRTSHTQAKKAIDCAGSKLDGLVSDIRGTLDELEEMVTRVA